MDRGKFIVIEGLDGSGKSLQCSLLEKKMQEQAIKVYATRECSDGPIGKLLRSEYLSGRRKCDERVINYLMAADRLDHISNKENGMLRFINNGVNVVCDRYVLSSLAYDTYMHVRNDETAKDYPSMQYMNAMSSIVERNRVNLQLLSPDITIVIDVPPEVSLKRITANRDEISVYESLDKLKKIKVSYERSIGILRKTFNHNIVIINGEDTVEKVSEQIWNAVSQLW